MSQTKVAKPAQWKGAAVLPNGTQFRPLHDHVFAAIIPLPAHKTVLAIPEGSKADAPLGRVSNKPVVWGKVLAIGPKVKTLQVGDVVFIHPLNTNERTIDGISYYIPREAAVFCTVNAE